MIRCDDHRLLILLQPVSVPRPMLSLAALISVLGFLSSPILPVLCLPSFIQGHPSGAHNGFRDSDDLLVDDVISATTKWTL